MNRNVRQVAVVLSLIASLAASPAYSQQSQTPVPASHSQAQPGSSSRTLTLTPDYSFGQSFYPHFTLPYRPLQVPEPMLTNSPRIEQLIVNNTGASDNTGAGGGEPNQGRKLMLSLEDAISLALENNMDIAVQRFTPWLDETALLRARSGVNGRLVFDPVLTGTGYISQASTPINNPFLAGVTSVPVATSPVAPNLISHNGVANFNYAQGFATGTQLQVTFDNTRSSINFPGDLFNPYEESTLAVQVTQPLLNGFGRLANTRYILESKNTVKVGESQFAQQVINTVTQIANDYWELVYARENVKVEQATVGVDQTLYENNKKQLEIGTMAPLDVITAESQLASDQQALVQAQTTQLQDETTLLVAITKDPLAMSLSGVEIVPTTPIPTPDVIETIPLQTAVQEALSNTTISTATGFASVASEPVLFANGTPATLGTPALPLFVGAQTFNTVTKTANAGLVDAWGNMIHNNYPTYEAGINLTLPIRNRAAQANNAQASLTQRQQEVQYRQTQNTIVLNVRQALIALVQDRAAVTAAEKAQMLAQQTLDDEQKKYQLGSSTSYNVVLRTRDLTAAQGTLLRDRINLVEAEVNFNQAMGRTLDVNQITVADARTGKISRAPNIPGAMDTDGVRGR
jgi:outer membrane protein